MAFNWIIKCNKKRPYQKCAIIHPWTSDKVQVISFVLFAQALELQCEYKFSGGGKSTLFKNTFIVVTVILACKPQTHFPVVAFSEGEKRRPEMRLQFAGYSHP